MIRIVGLFLAASLFGQNILPLREVRAGMRGVGRTVFAGDRVEEFQVDILGVLENAGPKQSIILGRLSGGPLAGSGVMQGMSGSPVYVDGKLLGAVALAFAFSKEPIAGIRPIEEMLRSDPPRRASGRSLDELAKNRPEYAAGGARMLEIATPLSFGGFTRGAIEQFTPQLRALGLEPMQGAGGGGRANRGGSPAPLQPGSMISVQLVNGDLSVGADGTVTHIDGNRVFAFGHRFLSMGPTEMPFARAEVLALLPNLSTSFKISAAREWVGAITADYSAAIAGRIGQRAAMVPVSINVKGRDLYKMDIVEDRLLTPFLLQMATYSAIDGTERTTGSSTVDVKGRIRFAAGAPVSIDNTYAAETNVALLASLAASIPLSYAMQSGFGEFKPKGIDLDIDVQDDRRLLRVEQLWTSRTRVRPGESFDVHLLLGGPGGVEMRRKVEYRVPVGASAGNLQITAADAMTTNIAEYASILTQPPDTAGRVVEILNGLRGNSAATLRINRVEPGFVVHGRHLPDPPPSLALLLRNDPGAATPAATSKLAQFDFPIDGWVVSGARTTYVQVLDE
ncbi:MAG: SpoIVB peptidase S55 domain-containing protein [Bryobacteraceae bacterium]